MNQQRVEIIKKYLLKSTESVGSTLRALHQIYGRNNLPSKSSIEVVVEKFESTFRLQILPVAVRQRSVENIAAAEAHVVLKRWASL